MKIKLALAAATMLFAHSASAATLNLTYDGSASGYRVVTFGAAPVAPAGGQSRVYAGGFDMQDSTPGGLGDFVAWCLDIAAYLGTSGSHEYETTDTPFGNGGAFLGTAGMSRIASVFNANFGSSVTSSANNSAAFQLALWESVYDDDNSISTGAFRASASSQVEAITAGYLTAAANYSGPSNWDLTYLESTATNRRQNLVTAAPSPVPLPASGLMLLAAVGGLVVSRRSKGATA